MHRGYRYRLYPSPEQAATLERWIGVVRYVYNVALWQRDNQWRQYLANTGRNISFASQCRELTLAREQIDWIKEVPRTMQEQALRDLDAAFAAFFRHGARYPRYRHKGEHETVRFCDTRAEQLSGKWSAVLVPKLGMVRFRDTRARPGRLLGATISRRNGQWFVALKHEIDHVAVPSELGSVGIDRGVANTLTLSTGEMLSVPDSLTAIERRQRRARRTLSRRCRGSVRHAKQLRRVAALSARAANIRRDWHHRVTTDLVRRFGCVSVEALKVANMTAGGGGARKRGLNRSILNQGWGIFTELLAYKLEERGGTLLTVNPAYTSQTCSACGVIDAESRESQARFVCRHCGHEAHADVNAAINILRRSTPVTLVEGAGCGPGEARTTPNQALAA